jgi:hypothetical protein
MTIVVGAHLLNLTLSHQQVNLRKDEIIQKLKPTIEKNYLLLLDKGSNSSKHF